MEIRVCQDESEAARFVSRWTEERIRTTRAKALFLPAGATPVPLYRLWEKERPAWLSELSLLQVDEVVSKPGRGRFRAFFEKELPHFAPRIIPVEKPLPHGEKIGILGLGVNGHIAFHEPGLLGDFQKGEVELSELTCKNLGLPLGTRGLSYGAGEFLRCASLLVLVTGSSKQEILREFVRGKTGSQVPASFLLPHPDLTVVADPSAAKLLYSQ